MKGGWQHPPLDNRACGIELLRLPKTTGRSALLRGLMTRSGSTEQSSVLPRVETASQRKVHFGTGAAVRRRSLQCPKLAASNGCENSKFAAYSLLFAVLCRGQNRRFL